MAETNEIAALYVQDGGIYFDLDGVEPGGLPGRDARDYAGDAPVVAHPPCSRWCMPLAVINQTRYGHKVGDDGGCFAHALAAVRRCGGVLEHPANTAAFRAYGIPKPWGRGWQRCLDGGWVCSVAQSAYGHPAAKKTWLYYCGSVAPENMRWEDGEVTALVSYLTATTRVLPRLSKKAASATPIAFRDALISLARLAKIGVASRVAIL